MKRRHLMHELQQLDQQLNAQRVTWQQRNEASLRALQRIHPLYLAAAGFISGAIIGRLGWRRSYLAGKMGSHLFSLIPLGIQHLIAGHGE